MGNLKKKRNIKMKFRSEIENEGLAGKNTVGGGDSGGAGRKESLDPRPKAVDRPCRGQRLDLFRKGDAGSIRGQRGAGFPAGERQDHPCLLSLRFDKFRSLYTPGCDPDSSWGPLVT